MNKKNLDPITTEIIQSSLQAACDEMFVAMRKTAMSSIIYEVLARLGINLKTYSNI